MRTFTFLKLTAALLALIALTACGQAPSTQTTVGEPYVLPDGETIGVQVATQNNQNNCLEGGLSGRDLYHLTPTSPDDRFQHAYSGSGSTIGSCVAPLQAVGGIVAAGQIPGAQINNESLIVNDQTTNVAVQ